MLLLLKNLNYQLSIINYQLKNKVFFIFAMKS